MEDLEALRRAGRITSEARDMGASLIVKGARLEDVANAVEEYIIEHGARPAFPVNISINDIAAHYTPTTGDKSRFEKGDLVKLDVGAHIDGFIGDTALTVEVGTNVYGAMIDATRKSLFIAIDMMAEGVPINAIGGAIASCIEASGYRPVVNLTGHQIKKYDLHAGLTIPNIDDGNKQRVEAGMVLAVEPFATDGAGRIKAGKPGNIYRVLRDHPIKDPNSKELFNQIKENFGTLPFCERWCTAIEPKAKPLLNKLMRHGTISSYVTLREVKKGNVSQWEHTLLVNGRKVEVLTM